MDYKRRVEDKKPFVLRYWPIIIALASYGFGGVVWATTVKADLESFKEDVVKNADQIDELKPVINEIGYLKDRMQELKTQQQMIIAEQRTMSNVLARIEAKLDS